MKFYHKPKSMLGAVRIKNKFLFLPLRIGNITKWLERATWKEELIDEDDLDGGKFLWWEPKEWI